MVGVAVLFHEGPLNAFVRRTFLRNVAADSAEMERIVGRSGLDWTVARPPLLTDGPLTQAYAVADERMPPRSRLSVSRADLAHCLVEELEHPAHLQRIVGIAAMRGR